MMVKYQTNMTVTSFENVKITKFIPKFMNFEFTVSLDGMGKTVEYVRRRCNWEEIVRNIKEVKQFPNVTVNINGAISFLSVLRFYELLEWIDKNNGCLDRSIGLILEILKNYVLTYYQIK